MRPIIKSIASFVVLFLMSATTVQAQGYLSVNFKNGKEPLIFNQDSIQRLDFVYKNQIVEESFYSGVPDTLYLPASRIAPASGYLNGGYLRSGEEITATTDCDWLRVELRLDTLASRYNGVKYYYYNFFADKNASKQQRTCKITFKSGDAVYEKLAIQRPYVSTFTNTPRWDKIDKQYSVTTDWVDTVRSVYVYPNFGIKLKEKPEWVKEVIVYNFGDDEYENADEYSGLSIRFDENFSKEPRNGRIVLTDYFNGELFVDLTQNGVDNDLIVSQLNAHYIVTNQHYDWGYGSVMHVRDVMTGDMTVASASYDWYNSWASNRSMGEDRIYSQFLWYYFRDMVYAINKNLEAMEKIGTDTDKAVAYAYRALTYLDWAQMYEFLPNDATSPITAAGNDVTNLTVPIIDKPVYHYDTINVPRATRDEMAAFILSDLNKAEAGIVALNDASKELPHLDAVYGLKARLYMWLGDYANAKKYARLAIDCNSGHVMTREECLSTTDGFNTPEPWMWASVMEADDGVVRTGILNWTSWMSPEAQYGYSAVGATSMIDAAMYNRMSNSDFRKLMFKAPNGHTLASKVPYIDARFADSFPEYAAIKFRPNEGNTEEYSVGSASAYPIMRIEEMYFIEAEAAEHLNPGEGVALLQDFMTTYRDESYTYNANYDAIDEILFQKRVELWGEGQSFFDYKRQNMSVTRGYEGTNVSSDRTYNTNGRPAWMNICIVVIAKRYNIALEGWENPNPSDLYTPQY